MGHYENIQKATKKVIELYDLGKTKEYIFDEIFFGFGFGNKVSQKIWDRIERSNNVTE